MAINPDIRDQAYQFFSEEAPELLQVIEAGLLTLKQEHTIAKVHNLMRAAHSIKGGAASVELAAIATLAHRLESIFKALYSEALEIDTDLESQLLCAYDCLRLPLMEQITVGSFDDEQALAVAEPIFAQLEERFGDVLTQLDTYYIPSSAELGVDMTQSIFDVDVQEGLERLALVVAHPCDYEIAEELRAQAELFAGFAELLNLPEFGAIAQTALAALDAHPDLALEIMQQALADFRLARQAVLADELAQEESPSSPSTAAVPLVIETAEHDGELDEMFTTSQEDIFSNTAIADLPNSTESIDLEFVTEAISVSEEALGTPSLEEIFGSAVDSFESEGSASSSLVPVTSFNSLQTLHSDVDETALVSQSEEPINLASNELKRVSAHSREGQSPVTPNLTVRVDSERLGRMNNLVGELVINRNGFSLHNEQLQGAVQELLNQFARCQNLMGHLRELSDQMLVGTSSSGSIASHASFLSAVGAYCNTPLQRSVVKSKMGDTQTTDQSSFDSLELDRYGVLPSVLQKLFEDMAHLEESVGDITSFARATERKLQQQGQMLTQLRDELMWARMLPVGEVLQRFPRILRDLSTIYHKPVSLKLTGTGVLVDKAILEKLYDPLLHLLRNAFDHGIESPDIRRQRGKPEEGQIEIRAAHRGSQTIIEVRDDGQGLNPERIGRRALELGWLSAEQLSGTSNAHLFELIFEPGFSTANQVSELSGRGVGLDVVRTQLRSLQGSITVTSSLGVGTTFTLNLPLTLSIDKLLVCLVGSTALAFPSQSIEEIVNPTADQTKQSGTQRFLDWRGQLVPAYRLADFLDYACPLPETSPVKALVAVPSPKDWAPPMLVLRTGTQFIALEIDSLVTEQELTIKPFGSAIAPPSFTYGCTILGDGSLVPTIDSTLLLEKVLGQTTPATRITTGCEPQRAISLAEEGTTATNQHSSLSKTKATIKTEPTPTILVVDDAVAIRRTLAITLEREGFRVWQARDGTDAIEQLQQSSLVQLVICDLEMPNMNGFEFLSYRRQDSQLSKIPVVMLTSRSNDKHRWLAMQLGATAYFTKPYTEQTFVKAIKDIII